MMYSAYELNNQCDNIQPCRTAFPILNQSVVLHLVLIVASWPTYRFLRRQIRWSDIPISLRIFHSLLWSTVKGFSIVHEAEIDVFLEFSCFLHDPMNVNNSISGSPAFSKAIPSGSSQFTYCWSLAWSILSLLLCKMSAVVQLFQHSLAMLFGIGMKVDLFQSYGHCWMQGHPRQMYHNEECWQNEFHWRREWQTTLVFLPWEPHEQYKKAKRYDTRRWCPVCYWDRTEGNY